MKQAKIFGIFAILLLALFGVMSVANATQDPFGVSIVDLKVNGDSLNANQAVKTSFERDSELDVNLQLQTDNFTSAQGVEVSVFLTGNSDKVSQTTKPFDVEPNTIYTKSLTLTLPQRYTDGNYQLKVVASSPNSQLMTWEFPLIVSPVEHSISIRETDINPAQISAGRTISAIARLKNFGQQDEKDVKVVISIPELGVQQVDYINQIDKDEAVSSEEMILRIPANTKTGQYTVQTDVYYNDYDDKVSQTNTISVVGDSQAAAATDTSANTPAANAGKTVITVGPQEQSVAKGQGGVIYPLTISNNGNTAKSYTLTISGANDWATTKISPSNVMILNAGDSKQAYVYVAASENSAAGEHVFSVDVSADNTVIQQIPLKADVVESASSSAWDGVQKALTVGVILLVALIVVLGIVILYQKKFKASENKTETEEIAQTYY